MENIDPRRTIQLLDQLEALGFANDAFARLHHFRQHPEGHPKRNQTMHPHRAYCHKTGQFFADSNNARLQRRLELVLTWHHEYGGRFVELSEAAVREIPFRPL